MSADLAIVTTGLSKRYGRVLAVDNLDLQVLRGEIFGFVGPNGAGKSTTMRMLLGLVRPTTGSIQMLGMTLQAHLEAVLARTGSLIESPTFYPYLSGRDNLRVVADLVGVPASRIAPLLDLVDLSGVERRKYKTYSLGMKQRLGVAAALLGDPDLLLLDEPANGLDPAGIVEMRDLLRRLKAEGKTVFISSHVLHEIEQVCDRIAILQKGRIVVQGSVQQLLSGGSRVDVRVASPERAVELIRALPFVTGVEREGDRLVVLAPVDRAAAVNQALAEAGLFASEIRPHEESLEQYFLDVTGEGR
ncbi:MAG TPA: ATP-binding cassette domain-containing protein [Chloroflexota bacterium]|nr:ATP-binding cassette domain-containing protein [Chloroflexota bacterium]